MIYEHKNDVVLYGRLLDDLTAVTSLGGNTYFNGFVAVRRDSGTVDVLPVQFSGRAAGDPYRLRGRMVRAVGAMRSHTRSDAAGGHRHQVVLWAKDIRPTGEPYGQSVRMEGIICKPPVYRTTPFGREICDLMIAVNLANGTTCYIPVICWSLTARRMSFAKVGDMVELQGRFQSRQYEKTLDAYTEADGPVKVTRTAYEVSAKECRVIEAQKRLVAR